jgi:iron(II)-dependent oxidoreductase
VDLHLEIRAIMDRARAATDSLLLTVPDDELVAQVSPLLLPLVWEHAHAAHFEELWLLQTAKGDPPLSDAHEEVYTALEAERRGPSVLPPLRPEAVRAYADHVRSRTRAWLEHVDLEAPGPLLEGGFVFGFVIQHELQHQEAMLQTLELGTHEYALPDSYVPDRAPGGPDEIVVPGGTFLLGAVEEPWAYDNELAAHELHVDPFRIDRAPATNGQFMEFITDRGYATRSLWTDEGWEWREREAVFAPLTWVRGSFGWERTRFGRREPVPPWEPVQHVSWHEAHAFAQWAGKRLPTEAEWERAAGWHHHEGKRKYPWGETWLGFEANLSHRRYSPAAAGSYSGGVSPVGCVQMAGDVWEWTSSPFGPYPGFAPFPYPEHSEVFFGDEYRVLRGGSWATDGLVARASFRNWEYPDRRHLFAGFRLARDA